MQYLLHGVLGLGLWGDIVATFVMVQLTIAGVTLYLHRDQTHRGVDLHPALRHMFRFWLWLTTGQGTREWVAVHRKHHAKCETAEDPHSPQVYGLRKVLLEGAELYRAEACRADTLEKYGRGTPEDWLEERVYRPLSYVGVGSLLALDAVLFGIPGITMWAVQMMSIPFLAAGIVNGVGHHTGYRNFECEDASRNVVPWGLLLGGEELHNNHHAFPSSARFSMRPWEIDVGWVCIRILSAFGLATVRRVAPKPELAPRARPIDVTTLRAIIVNRMHVLRDYSRKVTLPVVDMELARPACARFQGMLGTARKLLVRQPALLDDGARERLAELLDSSAALRTVHEFREQLRALWEGANVSNERLLAQLREWCNQAEQSGINALEEFAARLRCYYLHAV
jgi:stearoyl-CoA desaturase (Delta-9 desaturase)